MFREATFSNVSFDGAAFNGVGALFDEAAFRDDLLPSGVTFGGDALFRGTTFRWDASFRKATFSRRVGFAQDPPGQPIDLDEAIVAAEAIDVDHQWPPGWVVEPDGKGGGRLRQDSADNQEAGTAAGPGPTA